MFALSSNPIAQARHLEGYSLERLGNRLSVSKQYLSRAEQGTYSGLNRNLIRWCAKTLEVSCREVERQYVAFQQEKRKNTAGTINPTLLARQSSDEPGHAIFKKWREGYWPSVIRFSVDMCVHPASVENYEDGIHPVMPEQVMRALAEVKLLDPNWSESVKLPSPRKGITDPGSVEALRAALTR